jgi:hypothetical protein
MATQIAFISAILFAQAFTLFAISYIGRNIMSTQEAVDAVAAQLVKVKSEIVSKIADLNVQIEDAGVKDVVDTSELVAAAQALDDIVPDAVADGTGGTGPAE